MPDRSTRPLGGLVDDVRVSRGPQGVFSQTHDGLAVVGRTVQLKPGERVVIDYHLHTDEGQTGTPVLRVTPVTFGQNMTKAPLRCP